MNNFFNFIIDSINGNDENNFNNNECILKTLDKALELLKTNGKIKILPGNYPGSHLTSINGPFSYQLEGTGLEVEIGLINHEGFVDGTFSNMKIRDLILNCSNSNIDFQKISFVGGHKMRCKGFLASVENPVNEIEFNDCIFGINFQITVESGMYNFTFKNCKFKSKIMPIIYVKDGDVEIKATLCNFNVPIVSNKRGCVYIYHTSCNFVTELWNGKECSVFSKDDEVALSTLKSYKIENELVEPIKELNTNLFSKALEINTDNFTYIQLKNNTEFIRVYGSSFLVIDLPDTTNINNGHKIEIVNQAPFITINDVEYYNRIINIRFITQSGWIFY